MPEHARDRLESIERHALPWLTPRERWLWENLQQTTNPAALAAMWGHSIAASEVRQAISDLARLMLELDALWTATTPNDCRVRLFEIHPRPHLRRLITLAVKRAAVSVIATECNTTEREVRATFRAIRSSNSRHLRALWAFLREHHEGAVSRGTNKHGAK